MAIASALLDERDVFNTGFSKFAQMRTHLRRRIDTTRTCAGIPSLTYSNAFQMSVRPGLGGPKYNDVQERSRRTCSHRYRGALLLHLYDALKTGCWAYIRIYSMPRQEALLIRI